MRYGMLMLSLLMVTLVCGQSRSLPNTRLGTIFLRFNPLGLADPIDRNLSAGFEYKVHHRWSLAMDLSWIFDSDVNNVVAQNISGIIIRPSIRRLFGSRLQSFVEGELHFKQATYTYMDWLGRDCVADVPSYEEYRSFRYRKSVYGIHFKVGSVFPLFRSTRYSLECYTGLGVRKRSEGIVNEKNCCYINPAPIIELDSRVNGGLSFAMPTGMRFIYRIR